MFGPPASIAYDQITVEQFESFVEELFFRRIEPSSLAEELGCLVDADISWGTRKQWLWSNQSFSEPDARHFYFSFRLEKEDLNRIGYPDEMLSSPPGTGVGVCVFEKFARFLAKEGFARLEATLSRDPHHDAHGGYIVWPRIGFNFNLPIRLGLTEATWLEWFQKSPRQAIERWQKEGETVEGWFDLAPESDSLEILRIYMDARRDRYSRWREADNE